MKKGMGWVTVLCGPMFSGKTEALLRQVRRLDLMGRNLMVFKPAVDTRDPFVRSRMGAAVPGQMVKDSASLRLIATECNLEVVAIDEAQFFDDGLPEVVRELAQAGVYVLVSGLDRDFLARPFGPMGQLLVDADEVDKLTAICHRCKGIATLTQRLVNGQPASPDDPLLVIGGLNDDKYEARCRKCWRIGLNPNESGIL